MIYAGKGSPESVVTGSPGALYLQIDGAVGSQLWQKQSGTAETGWALYSPAVFVLNAALQSGNSAGEKIQAAVTSLAATGGVIDCQDFDPSTYLLLDVDVMAGVAEYSIVPFTFLWGPHEVRVTATQGLRSHTHHILHGTMFVSKDANGDRVLSTTMFNYNLLNDPSGGVTTTDGSGTVMKKTPTDSFWAMLEPGSPLILHGRVPPLGRDETTINIGGGIDDVTASIEVASTTGFLSSGYVRIEDEIIRYTSVDATHFLGCTRGAEGTTAASHANTTPVYRPTHEPFVVQSVSGSTIVLDHNETVDFTSTGVTAYIGGLDISFSGTGTFDGNKDPTADDANNPVGINAMWCRRVRIGPGLTFRNFDHSGVFLRACQDCSVDARVENIGYDTGLFGIGVWIFGWSKRNVVMVDSAHCASGAIGLDDRTTTGTLSDGPPTDCYALVRTHRGSNVSGERGMIGEGCQRCRLEFGVASGMHATSYGIALNTTQWVTNTAGDDNVLIVGSGDYGYAYSISSAYIGKRTTAIVHRPAAVASSQNGVSIITPPYPLGLTYGASITPVPLRSEYQVITITDGAAFTIENPATTSRSRGRLLVLRIKNSSGGAHGAITMGTEYKLDGGGSTLPAIGDGKSRLFTFRWEDSAWFEVSRSQGDVG